MNWEQWSKQITTFCAMSLLFLGSLFYFIMVAFRSSDSFASSAQVQDLGDPR